MFSSPSDCVAAVVEFQRALGAHGWPDAEQVRVRCGVHVGEVLDTTAGPVGLGVHRAARVAAVAHGGQVLLSLPAAVVVRDALPAGVSLLDLGLHRLKDLGQPEQIFQLRADGLERDFPPLRSLDNPELANNLPGHLSAFIGREAELGEIRALLGTSRLVTLTGAGGSGKTRLALQAAAELLDGSGEGVWFVDLATIVDGDEVPRAFASTLGIREQAARPLLEVILDALRSQNLLVVLDNCEHVVGAAAKLADQLERNCPKLQLLATSREALGIDGERVYRVRPLSLPDDGAVSIEDLDGSDAVTLFVERARSHDSTMVLEDSTAGLVASICRRLDGVPFAIELAAARLASMSLLDLHQRLDQRFSVLTGGVRTALPRQQTLRATLDWSFDLLSGPEQAVLAQLSVFVGGFDLDAAEAVCAPQTAAEYNVADVVGSLVNKSLVVAERSSTSLRYRLLETTRQYAADQLIATGGEAERRRPQEAHAAYYVQLAETAAPDLTGGPGQGSWLKRLDLEWDNVRATLAYLSGETGRTEDVLRFGVALCNFFGSRGHLDAIAHLRVALGRSDMAPAALEARALSVTGDLVAYSLGLDSPQEMNDAVALLERGLQMARDLDDREVVAHALSRLCLWSAFSSGDVASAVLLAKEALEVAQGVGDPRLIGLALDGLARFAEDPEQKRQLHLESLRFLREGGNTYYAIPELWELAANEALGGRPEAAKALYQEAISAAEEISSPLDLVWSWSRLSFVLLSLKDFEAATMTSRKALVGGRQFAHRWVVIDAIFVLACCATGAGDYRRAAQLTGAYEVVGMGITTRSSSEHQAREENEAQLRRALGDADYERAVGVGTRLRFEEAVDLALGKIPAT